MITPLPFLQKLISYPTVSHEPIQKCVDFLSNEAQSLGFSVEQYPSSPTKSNIVARPTPQQYEKHISDDFNPPMLRRRLGEEVEEDSIELLKVTRDLQGGATLFAILQKKVYVTVPGTGPSGQYDESLIPSQFQLNGAISSVFKDDTQKALFASWLRASSVQEFVDVEQVDFVGFVDESWTQPDFSMSMEPIVVQTHWETPSV